LQISDAGFNVGLLCAAFFAPRDYGIEGVSHATKISLRLCTRVLALQPPWHVHVIPEEKSLKAARCAAELFPVIGVGHRRPLAVFVATRTSARRCDRGHTAFDAGDLVIH
jgi:hypothetical protein